MIEPSFRQVRIERLPYTGEALVVEDSRFAKSLAPEHSINGVVRNCRIIAFATLAAVAVAVGVWIWLGYPRIADNLALALPFSLEQRLGGAISASFARNPLEGPGIDDHLRALVLRLAKSRASPYTCKAEISGPDSPTRQRPYFFNISGFVFFNFSTLGWALNMTYGLRGFRVQ